MPPVCPCQATPPSDIRRPPPLTQGGHEVQTLSAEMPGGKTGSLPGACPVSRALGDAPCDKRLHSGGIGKRALRQLLFTAGHAQTDAALILGDGHYSPRILGLALLRHDRQPIREKQPSAAFRQSAVCSGVPKQRKRRDQCGNKQYREDYRTVI